MNNKIQIHKSLCDQLNETYQKKNSDYGDSFGKSVRKRGITAAMVRMEDKWNRLDNLTLHPENIMVNDETIGDTLLDLANYCLMTYMELNPNLSITETHTIKIDGEVIKTSSSKDRHNNVVTKTVTVYKDFDAIEETDAAIINYATASHCDKEYE